MGRTRVLFLDCCWSDWRRLQEYAVKVLAAGEAYE